MTTTARKSFEQLAPVELYGFDGGALPEEMDLTRYYDIEVKGTEGVKEVIWIDKACTDYKEALEHASQYMEEGLDLKVVGNGSLKLRNRVFRIVISCYRGAQGAVVKRELAEILDKTFSPSLRVSTKEACDDEWPFDQEN